MQRGVLCAWRHHAVVGASLALAAGLCVGPAAAAAGPTVRVVTDVVGEPWHEQVKVTAYVTSEYAIQRATATIGGVQQDLACCWLGAFDASAMSYGERGVYVTVVDSFGATATGSATFKVDRPPRVTATLPPWGTVARPSVRVQFRCEDDSPEGCDHVNVLSVGDTPSQQRLLGHYEGTSSHAGDFTFSLAPDDGLVRSVVVAASDAYNSRETWASTKVWVERSPRLREVTHVDGVVLAYDAQRLLWVDAQNQVWLRPAPGAPPLLLARDLPAPVGAGYLTSVGAAFALLRPQGGTDLLGLYSWSDGGVTEVGTAALVRAVAGDWALVREGSALVRADLTTGTTVTLPANALNAAAVAPNGDVVYAQGADAGTPAAILRWRDGAVDVVHSPRVTTLFLATDGVNVLFDEGQSQTSMDLFLFRNGDTRALTEGALFRGQAVLRDGWVAFTRGPAFTSGTNVWLHAPDGGSEQMSFFNDQAAPEAVGPEGQLLVSRQGRRYLPLSGAPPLELSSELGDPQWLDGGWHVALGSTVFRISLEPDAGPWLGDEVDAGTPDDGTPDGGTPDGGSESSVDGGMESPPKRSGCTQAAACGGGLALLTLLAPLTTRRRRG